MSTANSIARGGREPDGQADALGPEIPAEVWSRYEVRLTEAPNGEQRIGLFGPGNREVPAIEITADRIVARREDAETVDSLVRIAQHNGWDRIDVDGSPEFRKAVWTAATREGVAVSGYEATFAEREQAQAARRGAPRSEPKADATERTPDAGPTISRPAVTISPAEAGRPEATPANAAREPTELSDGDSRLLLRISALSEDRRLLAETLGRDMPRLAREVQVERVGENAEALRTALDRALESPSLARSFERSGYPAEDLRGMGARDEWDGGVADAIYLVRTGLHRNTMAQDRPDRGGPEIGRDMPGRSGDGAPLPRQLADAPVTTAPDRRDGGEALAELFLNGSPERVAADPRLAGAARAQSAMAQHIDEVFGGDATRVASANLESRQLISDALRRGLDVSVREPTPVRQIEPLQTRPDLER